MWCVIHVTRYPFLLPNMFGACWALMTLPLVIFCLPETKDLGNMQADGEVNR